MGITANQARLQLLTVRQHDLELNAQKISQQKLVNASDTASVALKYSNDIEAAYRDDGTADTRKLEDAKKEYETKATELSKVEKLLDMQLQQINTEHTAVKTEFDSTKSLISDNTEKSFSLFG